MHEVPRSTDAMTENYIVRICRSEKKNPHMLVGIVEEVGIEGYKVNFIEKPVTLDTTNFLSVEVRGKPGGAITVKVKCPDDDPLFLT